MRASANGYLILMQKHMQHVLVAYCADMWLEGSTCQHSMPATELQRAVCSVEVHVTEPMLTSQREDAVVYKGEGEKFARRLSKVIHGGQVVLSEIAWASIQDQIPGQSQVHTASASSNKQCTFVCKLHFVHLCMSCACCVSYVCCLCAVVCAVCLCVSCACLLWITANGAGTPRTSFSGCKIYKT